MLRLSHIVSIVKGSALSSDLCAPVPFIKNKLRLLFLNHQASGDPLNFEVDFGKFFENLGVSI